MTKLLKETQSKMHFISRTHHEVKVLKVHGMVQKIKNWISQGWKVTFTFKKFLKFSYFQKLLFKSKSVLVEVMYKWQKKMAHKLAF